MPEPRICETAGITVSRLRPDPVRLRIDRQLLPACRGTGAIPGGCRYAGAGSCCRALWGPSQSAAGHAEPGTDVLARQLNFGVLYDDELGCMILKYSQATWDDEIISTHKVLGGLTAERPSGRETPAQRLCTSFGTAQAIDSRYGNLAAAAKARALRACLYLLEQNDHQEAWPGRSMLCMRVASHSRLT